MKAIVYITTNLINGKKYIGSTTNDSKYYFGSNICLKQDIKQYSTKNFIKQVLWEGPLEHRYEMEEYYIDYYNAADSDLFYNISKKGAGTLKGVILSKEHKANISAGKKGKTGNATGKTWNVKTKKIYSEETKAKMSAAAKNRWSKK